MTADTTDGNGNSTGDTVNDAAVSSQLDPARWSSILSAAISANSGVRSGNAVTYLIDGPTTFSAMLDAINSATTSEHFIYLLGWRLVDDFSLTGTSSTTFRSAMSSAGANGVQIRVMLWKQYQGVNQPQVDFINTLATGAAILDNATSSVILGAHHQKVLVVKGANGLVGFCGGVDINSDRVAWGVTTPSTQVGAPPADLTQGTPDASEAAAASGSSSGAGAPLHDVHCQVLGPAASDLLLTFIRRWDHHPDSPALNSAKGDLLGRTEPTPSPVATPSSTGNSCAVAVARTFTPVTPGTAVPKERDIQALLLAAIASAQRFIYMEDQYLINPDAATALNARIPNLQHLTILIAASEISDLPCRWHFREQFISTLTAGLSASDLAKVRVFTRITPPASTPPNYGPHTYVHAKTWIFDDELAVIGSANCNRRGWQSDSEADAFIFDDVDPNDGSMTFAQKLRCDLWAEHLGVPASGLADGVASISYWTTSTSASCVTLYDPNGGSDSSLLSCDSIRDLIDPPG